MKKTYFPPSATTLTISTEALLAASPGVETGNSLGNGYNDDDQSFTNRRHTTTSIWNNEQ